LQIIQFFLERGLFLDQFFLIRRQRFLVEQGLLSGLFRFQIGDCFFIACGFYLRVKNGDIVFQFFRGEVFFLGLYRGRCRVVLF
jgi:hypothetical protein